MRLTEAHVREILPRIQQDLWRWRHLRLHEDLEQEALCAAVKAALAFRSDRSDDWIPFVRTQWRRAIYAAAGRELLQGFGGVESIVRSNYRDLWGASRRHGDDVGAIVADTGATVETARAFVNARFRHANVDDLVGGLAPSSASQTDEIAHESRVAEEVRRAVARLPDADRDVIESRYLSRRQYVLREVGARFGVSRERIAQRERRALKRLRLMLSRLRREGQ